MFSLGIPYVRQNFSKCFLSSGCTYGFRAIGRVTVTVVSSALDSGVADSRVSLHLGGEMNGSDGCSGRSLGDG